MTQLAFAEFTDHSHLNAIVFKDKEQFNSHTESLINNINKYHIPIFLSNYPVRYPCLMLQSHIEFKTQTSPGSRYWAHIIKYVVFLY